MTNKWMIYNNIVNSQEKYSIEKELKEAVQLSPEQVARIKQYICDIEDECDYNPSTVAILNYIDGIRNIIGE